MTDTIKTSRRAILAGAPAAALAGGAVLSGVAIARADGADPVFEVIERYRAAHEAMIEAYEANDLDDRPHADGRPWDPNKQSAMDRYDATGLLLWTTEPTTLAGAAALLNYVLGPSCSSRDPADDPSILEDEQEYFGERGEAAKSFLPRFAQRLTHIALQRGRA